ncbi:DUF2066 domain-containing protein [uncultured Shewanella sp.]|uniref:DUF2066 domain-containing protein n=1 Tax=Shewanella atlantica TaxID=271099 RepID=UPI00260EE7A6|nr:DUF2066 domain-containing protein [uncultured Shewanella sp.]
MLIQTNIADAAEVSKLDESLVPVNSRSVAERNKAISAGLKSVILKNSGSQSALAHPSIQAVVKQPTTLISQYGYQELDGELFLQVSFDHKRIIRLLREAQLPVWGKQRPLTLAWIVEDSAGERRIINDESLLDSRALFDVESEAKGVPLLFPLMDLDDNMKVSANDVRGMFADQVAAASQRYRADYFVMASIDTRVSPLKYSLALYPVGSGEPMHTSLVSKQELSADINTAVNDIITTISEYYVGRYAIADTGEDIDSYVTFVDITEMKQLVDIEKYLSQLSAVKAVQLRQLKGTNAQYKLELFGTEEDLHRLMDLEPRVHAQEPQITDPFVNGNGVATMMPSQGSGREYRWQG